MSKITITTREYDDDGRLTREVVEEKNVPEVMAPAPKLPYFGGTQTRCSACGTWFTGTHICHTYNPPIQWTYTS